MRRDLLGERRQLGLRHLGEQIEDIAERDGAFARFRQKRGRGKIERLRDRPQDARRWVADAAFDLRQVPLRDFRSLRQLPPRHAALGAIAPHFAADRGEESRNVAVAALRSANRAGVALAYCPLGQRFSLMHYSGDYPSLDRRGIAFFLHYIAHGRLAQRRGYSAHGLAQRWVAIVLHCPREHLL
jgi:hypothetical protein